MTNAAGLNGLVSLAAARYADFVTFRAPGFPCRRVAEFDSLTRVQGRGRVSYEDSMHFADEIAGGLGVTIRADRRRVGIAGASIRLNDIRDGSGVTAHTFSRERVAFHALYLAAAELCLQIKSGGREHVHGMSLDIEDLLYIYSAKVTFSSDDVIPVSETYRGLIWLKRLLAQVSEHERVSNIRIVFQNQPILDLAPGRQRADALFSLIESMPLDDFDAILLGGWELFKEGDLAVLPVKNGLVDLADIISETRVFLEA